MNANVIANTTIDATDYTDVAQISISNGVSGDALTVSNTDLTSTYGISIARGMVYNINTAASIDATEATVSAAGAGQSTSSRAVFDFTGGSSDVETVNVAASGSNFLTVNAMPATTKLALTGAATNNLVVGSAPKSGAYHLDASKSTGANTLGLGTNFSNNTTVSGGTGSDTLSATIATTAQNAATISGVEAATLTFTASGTFSAANTSTDLTTATIDVNGGSARLTNVAQELDTINLGSKTARTSATDNTTIQYVTDSESDVTVSIGATPSSGKAAIDVNDLTVSRNAGALTIESNGTASNLIDDVTANSATTLTIRGGTQALTTEDVSATAAETVNFDSTLKALTIGGATTLDETTTAVNLTSDAAVLTVGAINQESTSGDIDVTYTLKSGAKELTMGNADITVTSETDKNVNAVFDVSSGEGAVTASVAGVLAGEGDLTFALNANATSGTVTFTDIILDDDETAGNSNAALNLTAAGGDVTVTDLTLEDINTTDVNATIGEDDAVSVTIGGGDTGNLNSILATGAGDFTFAAEDLVGDTSATTVNTTALTGDVDIDLTDLDGDVTATLGTNTTGTAGTISLTTGIENDFITAGNSDTTIIAGAGADTVNGGSGDDIITGGEGADSLTGGDGDDTFVQVLGDSVARTAEDFTEASLVDGETITFGKGVDIITDFNTATDEIDTVTANDLTTFAVGSDVQAAEITVDENYAIRGDFAAEVFTISDTGADTLVLVDADGTAAFGDAGQTSMMVLQGVTDLAAANFV